MLTDGLSLLGSSVADLTIANGSSLPVSGNAIGRLFYLTSGTPGLRVFTDSGWIPLSGISASTANTFTKAQVVAPVTLTSGATINTDASLSNNFHLVLAANATLTNPTNLTTGQTLNYQIVQDAAGSRLLTFGNLFKWASGTVPALSTVAGAVDFISAYYNGSVLISSIIKDVK